MTCSNTVVFRRTSINIFDRKNDNCLAVLKTTDILLLFSLSLYWVSTV